MSNGLRPVADVYTIPPDMSFVDALATGLMARYGHDPLTLGRVTVLLPTRRAVKSLREAFLRLTGGQPLLLPAMQPIGDVDEEELVLSGGALGGAAAALDLPPEMPPVRRQLLLTRLVMHKAAVERDPLVPAQAAVLAQALGQLLDQVQTEGLSFDALQGLATGEFAAHWQKTLDFLKIITVEWPKIVADAGYMDRADRRNRLLRALTMRWSDDPPQNPVIAAGSTGSVPASAELMEVVARLPQGALVLPGLHADMDEASWQALDATHPQFTMRELLDRIGVVRHEVKNWVSEAALSPRAALIREALRPAATTGVWRDGIRDTDQALAGLFRVDAPGPREEAGAIALMLREVLETPGRTGVLITPDRQLARRVTAELGRWGIEIDDSAGQPLPNTAIGTYLRLTAEMIGEALAPVSLLAALKHPLAAGGMKPADFRRMVRALETKVLRGPRPGPGTAGIAAAIGALAPEQNREKLADWWASLAKHFAAFEAMADHGEHALTALLEAHIRLAEALAETDAASGSDRLWRGEAGEVAAAFIEELHQAAETLGPIEARAYPAFLNQLMTSETVRPRYGRHPRLNIWGPLEARLQQADLVILGGLNEGAWPPETAVDPWMSRPMRANFGLPPLERRIGLSAHDFAQAVSAPAVVMTRSQKIEGTPTVPSRWLLRIDALLQGRAIQAGDWLSWYAALDRPDRTITVGPPAPRPPVEARPKRLSVTQIQTWMQDPYSLYARHILKLEPLDPIDAAPGAADRGTYIHDALDRFLKAYPKALPDDALSQLMAMGEAAFGAALARPTVWAFWWPRFGHIAAWFVKAEAERRTTISTLGTEIRASYELPGTGVPPFTLRAKADRVDLLPDGSLEIIDYKTGIAPKERQLHAGYAPQLPLEAMLAEAGAFEGIIAKPVSIISFWRMTGGDPPVDQKPITKDVADLTRKAREGLLSLVKNFDNPATPYLSKPRPVELGYGEYDHLARVREWLGVEAEEERRHDG